MSQGDTYAVEWFTPNTLIGDGRPFHGLANVEATSKGEAWDRFDTQAHSEGLRRVVLRVGLLEDLCELAPLRDLIDAMGLR